MTRHLMIIATLWHITLLFAPKARAEQKNHHSLSMTTLLKRSSAVSGKAIVSNIPASETMLTVMSRVTAHSRAKRPYTMRWDP